MLGIPSVSEEPAEAGDPSLSDFVRIDGDEVSIPTEADYAAEAGETAGRVRDAVARLYGSEKFHRHICGLFGWVGRRKGLDSLQIDKSDEDFRAACEVVHRRLMDGPAGALLDRCSDQALEDVIVCAAGFGPVVVSVQDEIRRKARERRRAAGHVSRPSGDNPPQSEEEGPSDGESN